MSVVSFKNLLTGCQLLPKLWIAQVDICSGRLWMVELDFFFSNYVVHYYAFWPSLYLTCLESYKHCHNIGAVGWISFSLEMKLPTQLEWNEMPLNVILCYFSFLSLLSSVYIIRNRKFISHHTLNLHRL